MLGVKLRGIKWESSIGITRVGVRQNFVARRLLVNNSTSNGCVLKFAFKKFIR